MLHLRKAKGYPAVMDEFEFAVRSIQAASLYYRHSRNIFLEEEKQSDLENPTRWLDAILLNMSSRTLQGTQKVPQLTEDFVTNMLKCYSATGRNGKAVHFFYRVTRQEIPNGKRGRRRRGPPIEEGQDGDEEKLQEQGHDRYADMPSYRGQKIKVGMHYNKYLPPFYKLPSEIRKTNRSPPHQSAPPQGEPSVKALLPNKPPVKKLSVEKSPEWSPALAAAFAFAESLTHGACGHDPIDLTLEHWNVLIKACCYKGALMRALHLIEDTIPRHGLEPNSRSYNTVLSGLARVGDVVYMKVFLTEMTNRGIWVNKHTVQAMVDGHLNVGDMSGAVTLVQDMFNQHNTLPPYTTHLKILEFCLARGLIYEAKRHVFFIQQMMKWEPRGHESKSSVRHIRLNQKNPKLSYASLQRLFAYFGEDLSDKDFF